MNTRGAKLFGKINIRMPSYRFYRKFRVHKLVWAVWGNRNPSQNEFILHDDSKSRDQDGCVSNAIENLRLGTLTLIGECHERGKLSKRRKII